MTRALGLLSGGLDSILAVCVLREQGIETTAISFESPFFGAGNARRAAARLGIPLLVRDITAEHLEMMKAPRYGFGANMNPCIDCHILMVRIAGGIMREEGYDFVFTGEVLNERPMSQNRQALRVVEKRSGCEGLLLRPLSAALLDETVPEREGKVDRSRLLGLHGRSRKPQMALAAEYGVEEYPSPAGGCLLTDPGFSRRLRDLRDREGLGDVRAIDLLKVGRHFRLGSGRKIVVGRKEAENRRLREMAREGDVLLTPRGFPGPTVLVCGGGGEDEILEAARACARYGDAVPGETVGVARTAGGETGLLSVTCPAPDGLSLHRV
ncbi:MAG: asparagine synthase-related protein [bacterium]|nr:asparagine synthase-related protein [bacterium]